MTQNEKLFKEIEEEVLNKNQEEEKNRVKLMMRDILEKTEKQKQKKQEAEESLRILKLDLDDLRAGKIEKIRERHASERATQLIPFVNNTWNGTLPVFNIGDPFEWTSGDYTVTTNGVTKTFYF